MLIIDVSPNATSADLSLSPDVMWLSLPTHFLFALLPVIHAPPTAQRSRRARKFQIAQEARRLAKKRMEKRGNGSGNGSSSVGLFAMDYCRSLTWQTNSMNSFRSDCLPLSISVLISQSNLSFRSHISKVAVSSWFDLELIFPIFFSHLPFFPVFNFFQFFN